MNIDFIAILNAAITESVGALVTQQLALIVKPIEDMASKLHELTVRVAALEDGDVKFDDRSLADVVAGLQLDLATQTETLEYLNNHFEDKVRGHLMDMIDGAVSEAISDMDLDDSPLGKKIMNAVDERAESAFGDIDWTAGGAADALESAVEDAVRDYDFESKVSDVIGNGSFSVRFHS